MKKLLILLLLVASSLFGQASSSTAYRIRRGTSLPATCSVGDVFFKTSATVGMYQCAVTNTWSLVAGASSGIGGTIAATEVPYGSAANTLSAMSGVTWTNTTKSLAIVGTVTPSGSELITDGNFTTCPGTWTLGNNVTCSGGKAVALDAGGATTVQSNAFATTSGLSYMLTFTISAANAPVYFFLTQNGATYLDRAFSNGTHSIVFTTDYTGSAERVTFDDMNAVSGDTWAVDNVSVKQVAAVPASNWSVNGFDGAPAVAIGGSILANTAYGQGTFATGSITSYSNSAFGYHALQQITSGNQNNAFGSNTLMSNTTGTGNSAFGDQALETNSTGSANTALGADALRVNTTSSNTALGHSALAASQDGDRNTAVGRHSLSASTTGDNNTAVGYSTLGSNITGSGNVALGYLAGLYETASDSFYVDNQDRTDLAGGKAGAILYGTFNATPASQTLTINAATTVAHGLGLSGGSLRGFKGANVASTATMTLTGGNVFHITGTDNITTMNTCDATNAGRQVTLIFDGVLTFTDGNNLKLAGNFVTTADDTITLACDGVNWLEMSRSIN